MNATGAIGNTVLAQPTQTTSASSYADLDSEDYFKLLLAQLTNQDPMEPTSNAELLAQISAIRDIEASTSLTSVLKRMTNQQQFGSASAMIGQFVTGPPLEDGTEVNGVVVGVRFEGDGRAILLLDNGLELLLESVLTVESPEQLGAALVGKMIHGVDRRDPSDPTEVQGIVTSVRVGDGGDLVLELDTGEDVRLSDVERIDHQAATQESGFARVIDTTAGAIKGIFGI